jgi:hypothetical protein
MSANDFGLRLFNSSNGLVGESNFLNLPGLTGRSEEIVLRHPESHVLRSAVQHTGGFGMSQNVYGAVELTRVEYPEFTDLNALSPAMLEEAEKSLLTSVMLSEGRRFRPNSPVSRLDLAASFVRAGLVPQYLAAGPLFVDSTDLSTRNAAESVYAHPNGKLFFDTTAGGRFYPNSSASRLVMAVAMVKAAGLESSAGTTLLPENITDLALIPAQWRGFIAVALQRGYITLDGNQVNPNRAVSRIELSRALNIMTR